jgi:hypothetical protein
MSKKSPASQSAKTDTSSVELSEEISKISSELSDQALDQVAGGLQAPSGLLRDPRHGWGGG